jgi:hypothetical protein
MAVHRTPAVAHRRERNMYITRIFGTSSNFIHAWRYRSTARLSELRLVLNQVKLECSLIALMLSVSQ